MRQSRHWIETASDEMTGLEVEPPAAAPLATCNAQVALSVQQYERVAQLAAATGLEETVVLSRLVDAALAGPDRLQWADRHRLRRCIELLRAIELHVARAARSMTVRRLPPELTAHRVDDLLDLGRYLRRVGWALLPQLHPSPAGSGNSQTHAFQDCGQAWVQE